MFNLCSYTKPTFMRLCTFMRISVCVVCLSTLYANSAYAQSGKPEYVDLAPAGWNRNPDLVGVYIDQYRSASGSLNVDLMAFPPTDEAASRWMDTVLKAVLVEAREAGSKVTVINNDAKADAYVQGPMNSSGNGVDIATRTFTIKGASTNNRTVSRVARAIIRQGQPVQFSLLNLRKANATEQEWKQASSIRFEANVPYFEMGAAMLGLESMARATVTSLLDIEDDIDKANEHAAHTKKHDAKHKQAVADAKNNQNKLNTQSTQQSTAKASNNKKTTAASKQQGGAPIFKTLSGPQVRLTGKWLGSLPAGYRMHVKTTNYWTNSSMTETRKLFLTLTGDGQFEKGNWSIGGGSFGLPASVFSSDKNGSYGSVFGDTNPGGPGTKSIAMRKRKGLNPEMYGVYYISGNQIEFRYASGKVEKKSFKTDGHHELVIGKKRYFTSSPKGWEKRYEGGKITHYRSLDGAYYARVSEVKMEVDNGFQWMRDFVGRSKAKDPSYTATEIKGYKGQTSNYNVVRTTVTGTGSSGGKYKTNLYLKYGRFDSRLVQVKRYAGAKGENKTLEFIRYVD